jgi:HSP20 family protein
MTTVTWKSGQGSAFPEKRRMLIESLSWQVRLQAHVWSPPTDVFETEKAYVVRVEVAGMRQQDFSIQLENNLLTISGSRPDTPERRAYHQMEVRFGEFGTVVGLPGPVDLDRSSAEYEDGFLTVTLPKALPARIKIQP